MSINTGRDWLLYCILGLVTLAAILLMLVIGYRLVRDAWPGEKREPIKQLAPMIPRDGAGNGD